LEVGATADRNDRDHSLSAFRAARCSIHEDPPNFRHNAELELLFHWRVGGRNRRDAMKAAVDRIMRVYGMMQDITPEQEMEIRGKVVEYLKTAKGDEHKLAVEGLKYVRQLKH
jgi:hypothetical protein